MKSVYLDNAATTQVREEVIVKMQDALANSYGNPSSTHSFGRTAKTAIESARKTIAKYLNAQPSEIIFTSGGTEADNMILRCAVADLGVQTIITSKIEHHAVLHTAEQLQNEYNVNLHFVDLDACGAIDYSHLEQLLQASDKALVSLMHINNEIGNILDLKQVANLCKTHKALFHTDTVQSVGHYNIDLSEISIDYLAASAHKFHGPKGIGFIYVKNDVSLKPFITGGSQERNMRAGTENIYGIVGLAKALELAYKDLEGHQTHVQGLKNYMIEELKKNIPGVHFNGDSSSEDSLYTVLNVGFPPSHIDEMFL